MKNLLLITLLCPAVFLFFGYNSEKVTAEAPPLKVQSNGPVVVQIEHQFHPFDVNGNFPYVIMVDNVVHTFKKEDVQEFLNKGSQTKRGHGRTRSLTN
jgi:hypothetical protein